MKEKWQKRRVGRKDKVTPGPPAITTETIRRHRLKILCPRLGDYYSRMMEVENVMGDVADKVLQKASTRQSNTLSLSGMRLARLPQLLQISVELTSVVDINLSKNHLFDSNNVFKVITLILLTLGCLAHKMHYLFYTYYFDSLVGTFCVTKFDPFKFIRKCIKWRIV